MVFRFDADGNPDPPFDCEEVRGRVQRMVDACRVAEGLNMHFGWYAGVSAPSRAELVKALDQLVPQVEHPVQPLLRVELPCGAVREWATAADLPEETVPCDCGSLSYAHFFIRYGVSEE